MTVAWLWRRQPPRWGVAPFAGTLTVTAYTSRVIGVALLVLAQGCALSVGRGSRVPFSRDREARSSASPERGRQGFGPKAVEGKESPNRLVARDGTSCAVSEKKHQSTALGASVWCTWVDTKR